MKLITILLIANVVLTSCRKKEVYPDLAKQIAGSYNIYQASFSYSNPYRQVSDYNPKDSNQTGNIVIRKIDPLSANIRMVLYNKKGDIIYDYSFDSELSRDIYNKGFIKFNALNNDAGAY